MHTRGPMKLNKIANHLYVEPEAGGLLCDMQLPEAVQLGTDAAVMYDARLIAAAFNSYDKHFGERAVDCAENDLLGKALAALKKCHDAMLLCDMTTKRQAITAIECVLSWTPGRFAE